MEWKSVLYLSSVESEYLSRGGAAINNIFRGLVKLKGCGHRFTLTIL